MKKNPEENGIRRDMMPGRIIADGYLGDDERNLDEIVREDLSVLAQLGVTAEALADRMQAITDLATEGFGDQVRIDSGYLAHAEEFMGFLGCPYKDGKRLDKRNTFVVKETTGERLTWSDMNIHLIRAHGFFEGKGARYRLDPHHLVTFLGLDKRPGD
ncbi:MAG TPA: hypothetical protein GXZ64_02220 [Clostridiaceae bacterium]|nr:hypothetical protein [Clostridiaceae bacterium]